MLNDTERAALTEELAEAMKAAGYDIHWHVDPHGVATACLPIIERLLAEREHPDLTSAYMAGLEKGREENDLDALLESVHPKCRIGHMGRVGPDEWFVSLQWWDKTTHDRIDPLMRMPWDRPELGTGPTRMAAIRDAVKAAKEAQGHE